MSKKTKSILYAIILIYTAICISIGMIAANSVFSKVLFSQMMLFFLIFATAMGILVSIKKFNKEKRGDKIFRGWFIIVIGYLLGWCYKWLHLSLFLYSSILSLLIAIGLIIWGCRDTFVFRKPL